MKTSERGSRGEHYITTSKHGAQTVKHVKEQNAAQQGDVTNEPPTTRSPLPVELTVAKALVERMFKTACPPEILLSHMGPEFENKVVRQLQEVFGDKKTQTPSRPQGNSVSKRMQSTLYAILSCIVTLHRTTRAQHVVQCGNVRNVIISNPRETAPQLLPIDPVGIPTPRPSPLQIAPNSRLS